jgi:cysteine desulfurase
MKAIYIDHNATSRLRPSARERWLELQGDAWANARSLHGPGVGARRALERIVEGTARALGARPSEVIFTSGATESNHSALRSVTLELLGETPVRWAVGAGEHPSVFMALDELTERGLATQRVVGLLPSGQVDLGDLEDALDRCDALCLQVANHETGALTDLGAVGERVRAHGVPWHADAVQAIGRTPFRLDSDETQMITSSSVSGHKLGGPGGVGLLFWRRGTPFRPLLPQSGAQTGPRAGTPDVPGVGATLQALEESLEELERGLMADHRALRDALEASLCQGFPGAIVHGVTGARLDNTLAISLPTALGGWPDGEELVIELATRGLSVSTGAACATGSGAPSPVLTAMGVSPEVAAASLRMSLGYETRHEDLGGILSIIHEVMESIEAH